MITLVWLFETGLGLRDVPQGRTITIVPRVELLATGNRYYEYIKYWNKQIINSWELIREGPSK